jgi:hypothetical protein
MKKFLPLLLLLPLIFNSCGKSKIPEGEISYDVSYPYMEVTGLMSAILPKEMTIVFKGTKMKTTISRGHIFETVVITDETSDYIEMRLDFGDKKYYCELTPAEVKVLLNSQPEYTLDKTEQMDSVAGMWSVMYNVSCADSVQPADAWFTEDLTVQNGGWFSSYYDITGMPVIYDVERYGILMHIEANSFVPREVKDKEFDRPDGLTQVDFETYESEVQELFDILLD